MTGQELRQIMNNFQSGYWDKSLIPGHLPTVEKDLNAACEASGTMTDAELMAALFRNPETGEAAEDCHSKRKLEKAFLAYRNEPEESRMEEKAADLMEMVLTNFNLTELIR